MDSTTTDTTPVTSMPRPPRAFPFLDGREDVFQHIFDEFAQDLGRDVAIYNPHRSGGMEDIEFERLVERAHNNGASNPFLIVFFESPGVPGSRHRQIDYGEHDIDGNPVMFDAHGITAVAGDYNEAFDEYAEAIGSEYLEDLDADWLIELRRPDTRPQPGEWPMPAAGKYVTHLFRDAFFVPWDLPHTRYSGDIIRRLLQQAADHVGQLAHLSSEEREAERARLRAEAAERRHRERIESLANDVSEWASNLASRHLTQAESERETRQRQMREHRRQYIQAVERARQAHAQVEAARRMVTTVDPSDVAGLRSMLEQGTLTDIRFHPGNTIQFETRTLFAQDDRTGAYHRIGRMRISLSMETGDVTFANLDFPDGPPSGLHMVAPHVFGDGRPCMGNFAEMVADFVNNHDWFGFIQGAILFAESVNTEDIGDQVHHWPFISDPESVGLPPYDGSVEPYENEPHEDEDDEDYDDEPFDIEPPEDEDEEDE